MQEHPTILLKTNSKSQQVSSNSRGFGAYPTMFMKINKISGLSYDVDEKKEHMSSQKPGITYIKSPREVGPRGRNSLENVFSSTPDPRTSRDPIVL